MSNTLERLRLRSHCSAILLLHHTSPCTGCGIAAAMCDALFPVMCRFYFAYCEAAFDERYIHTFQVLWVKGAEPRSGMGAPAGATLAEAVAEPSRRPSSPDPMTQVFLAQDASVHCYSHRQLTKLRHLAGIQVAAAAVPWQCIATLGTGHITSPPLVLADGPRLTSFGQHAHGHHNMS